MTALYINHWRRSQRFTIPLLLVLFIANACKKTNTYDGHPATFQLFNGLNDGTQLYVTLSEKPPTFRSTMVAGNKEFTLRNNVVYVSKLPETLNFYAAPDTLPHNSPIISEALNVKPGSVYSMFIYGNKTAPAYSITEDHFPVVDIRGDSVTFIRFANFSEGQSISVNLKGKPNGSFIQNLSFKSLSDFEKLPADRSVSEYEFEVRNQVTGTILYTYTATGISQGGFMNMWVYKPNTLVFTGMSGGSGTNAQSINLMSHRGR